MSVPAPTGLRARLPLPVRLMLAAGVVVTLGLGGSGAALVWDLHRGLVASLDDGAAQRADDVAALLAQDGGAVSGRLPGDDSLVQVLDSSGRVLTSSPDLVAAAPLIPPDVAGAATSGSVRPISIRETDARLLVRHVGTAAGPRTVLVASPLDEVQAAVTRLSAALAVGVPVVVTALLLLVRLFVGWTLRTVERLRSQVDAVSLDDLHRRVDVPVARDGIRDLAVTMNLLLARLDEASAARRRFVADAAHELRSPLAGLRTQLEVAGRLDDADHWRSTGPAALDAADRLGALVDDLLLLARLDDAPGRLELGPVDLDEILLEEVRAARVAGGPRIDARQVRGALVLGDEQLLRRVVRNLLTNAVRHGRSQVTVSLHTAGGGPAVLVVADDGDGVPPAERERVFRRFHRLDPARDRDAGGTGLGLAIVADAVSRLGGSVALEDAAPGARFVIRIPVPGDLPSEAATSRTVRATGPAAAG